MTYAADAARLLARLGEALGKELKLEENACHTRIEGRLLSFFYAEDLSALFVQAELAELSALPDPGSGLETLLRSSHLWEGTAGGIFGLNPEDRRIYYSYRLDLPLPVWPESEVLLVELLPLLLGALEAAEDNLGIFALEEKAEVPAPEGALRV
ncbi:MAG: type III secretion system chaperone [Zoogloeaceae bacterium]|jgi:hypothetical protein|nr:type III secretion system chaperone [Zoogloeaceae bacterium]